MAGGPLPQYWDDVPKPGYLADGQGCGLLNMKAGVPANHEKRSKTLATFVGAVIIMRAFFVAHPNARVLLHGGVVHRYDQATRQLVQVDDDEQSRFEEQQRQATV